jgi:tetratricopeptide (TPR) repeat protein
MTELPLEKLRERARELQAEHPEPIQRVVAVLIMIVTLLAAVVAFLVTEAGTRQDRANREAGQAALITSRDTAETGRAFLERSAADALRQDFTGLEYALGRGAAAADRTPFSQDLARAYAQAAAVLGAKADSLFGAKYTTRSGFDYYAFDIDQYKPVFAASELQQAAARERGGWSSKRGRYIAVITIFAVSLFLLGLTLTVPPAARRPLVWAGSLVAAAAAIWGIVIFAGSVPKPSDAAIHYVADGEAKLAVVVQQPAALQPAIYYGIAHDMTAAIAIVHDYRQAYLVRGTVAFHLDLLNQAGPKGSAAAAADWKRALELDATDYVAWGDLAAAEFWLGDYEAALTGNERALALQPQDPTFNMNEAAYFQVLDRQVDYRAQLERLRTVLAALPTALREQVLQQYHVVFQLAERYRPKIAAAATRFQQDLLGIADQIEVSNRLYNRPTPPHIDTTVGPLKFEFLHDRTLLRVGLSYRQMARDSLFLRQVLIDGSKSSLYSTDAVRWEKTRLRLPSGSAFFTLLAPAGFKSGSTIRVEIYVDGNLLSAGSVTVPKS